MSLFHSDISFAMNRVGQVEAYGASMEPELHTEYKMAAGGWIKQYIIPDPFGPGFWSPEPEVLIVCYPVSEQQASQLLGTGLGGQRRAF